MSGELIRATEIMRHVHAGAVATDLAEEDLAVERARWEEGVTAADRQVAAAYRAIEDGRQLVDVHAIIAKGGYKTWLPNLAVAPAFAGRVVCRAHRDGTIRFRAKRRWTLETHGPVLQMNEHWHQGTAVEPAMPPDIRRVARKDDLILWEANWTKRRSRSPIDFHIDPALLEHVTGSLYVVKAAWDLSPLEAAALR